MSATDIPQLPPIAEKQAKSIDGTALSFYKAGMGGIVGNFLSGLELARKNAEKISGVTEPLPGTDDMRIDSDDIHYHYIMPQQKAPLLGSVGKIALGAALGAAGVGLPFALPMIASGLNGLLNPPTAVVQEQPAAALQPAQQPATGSGTPSVIINGEGYQLSLEGGEKDE